MGDEQIVVILFSVLIISSTIMLSLSLDNLTTEVKKINDMLERIL